METFGERLKKIRLEMKLNQTEFASIGGIKKGAQIKYESGERMPTALYLTAIAAAGADVLYVLTGHRSVCESQPGYALRPDQAAFLDNLEHCSREDQDFIKRMALRAAEATNKEETQPETPLNNDNQGNDDDGKNRIART